MRSNTTVGGGWPSKWGRGTAPASPMRALSPTRMRSCPCRCTGSGGSVGGYNQSEYLAAGLARALDKPVWTGILRRRRNNPSQTGARTPDRWSNVQDLFALRRPERLAGRHILLVDDVFTTGATLVSCAEAILAAVPDCRISMATLAVSARSLGPDRKG
ncbi:ComF family protein [Alistipes sp.]|uniref:ComF family protein n=1 Tax=Alistipes sp. TaxID=1872444 RepID=UPI003AB6EB54